MMTKKWNKRLTTMVLGGIMALSVTSATALAADRVDVDLEQSINLALQNNKNIHQSAESMNASEWAVKEAKGNRGLALSWNATANAVGGASYTNRDQDYSNTLTASLPVYTGGSLENSQKYAELGLDVSALSLENTRQTIKLTATKDYYTILECKNLLQVRQESVQSLEGHLKNVNAQYNVGTVAKSDVLRSEVELANARQLLVSAQNSYDLAMSSFNNDVGLAMDTFINTQEELRYEKYNTVLDDCIQYAFAHRPDGYALKKQVEQTKANIAIAKAGQLPKVSLAATQYIDGNDPFKKDVSDHWTVGVSASWDLFDSNVTQAKVKQAEATQRRIESAAQQQLDTIELEVRQAYLNIQAAEKNIQTTSTAVEKAQEDYKIAQVRYSAGVGTNLDVMDAQVALTTAKTNYIQALYDYNTSRASLEKAMGTPVVLDASTYK